jgi:hypothetical protein
MYIYTCLKSLINLILQFILFFSNNIIRMSTNAYLLNDPNKKVYSEILNEKSTFILSSMFWGRNRVNENSVDKLTYLQQVERIISNCREHKINYYFVEYPIFEEKGMYITALSLKSQFILNTLDKFPTHKVINVDTDFTILQYPHIFDMDADCFFINWYYNDDCFNPFQLELPGGVLGFANTHSAKVILNILNNYILKNPNLAEDKTFSGIFTRNFFNIYTRCVWLPYNYMYMFQKHEYDQENSKYTSISSYTKELKDSNYNKKDLVIVHRDLETYELLNIRSKRIGTKSIWPPNFYKQQGQKLRCLNGLKFNNYVNYGLTKAQIKHFSVDFKERDGYNNMILPKITFDQVKKSINEKYLNYNSNYIIITISQDKSLIQHFKNKCDKYNINHIVCKDNINKAQLFYKTLFKYKKNLLYVDISAKLDKILKDNIWNVKNMDLMTVNLDNTSSCYDPRILKTFNDNLYFLAYNKLTLQFLQIWNHYITGLDFQHKAFEYAFNKSLSINKLRCYWLSNHYIGKNNDKYSNNQTRMKTFIKKIPQCGIKPKLTKDGNTLPTHFYGSKNSQSVHNKYGKLFLEF